MKTARKVVAVFYLNLAAVALLVGYKVYLTAFAEEPLSIHATSVERIQSALQTRDSFKFAVLGNINNSIGIFERKIIPRLNEGAVDFVVSAGNAVRSGGEDKFRALQRSFQRLDPPYLLTFGDQESSGLGGFRFYRSFGPYFFAFEAGGTRFIFLDSTGETPHDWQLRWLEDELARADYDHVFLFLGHAILRSDHDLLFEYDEAYVEPPAFRRGVVELAQRYDVDAVFSANLPLFEHRKVGGVAYITTGGAGGLVVDDEASFHHYVTVSVRGEDIQVALERLGAGQSRVFKTLESGWLFLHSLIYTGYLNFLLLLSALTATGIKLHALIFAKRTYYRDFDLDGAAYLGRPLKIAMFTNNYLPFIGGVPIAIDRLRRGLLALGHKVMVIAPKYSAGSEEQDTAYRLPALLPISRGREFRLANIFHPRIGRAVRAFAPDVVHVHHPFWAGALGLRLGRRLGAPVLFTYHTRLEHYAHFVPVPGLLFRNLLSHYLIRRFANRCDGVIVPSASADEYLRALGVTVPISVQPTGIEVERFGRVSRSEVAALREQLGLGEERVLVSVSRLSREKNLEFMVRAIEKLVQRTHEAFRLLIVGDGDERRALQALIDARGLHETVILVGTVPPPRMPLYYALADVFVFASRSETQGMVILEAMAAGLPVVAVRSSGIDDMVRNEVTGFKTLQDESQWCEKVALLLRDGRLRERMSRNAAELAGEFTLEKVASKTNEFYAYLLARQERSRMGHKAHG